MADAQFSSGYIGLTKCFCVVGATLSAPDLNYSIQLLPGEYDDQSQPLPLHVALTDPSAHLSPSPGFGNSSSFTLPFTLAQESGVVTFSQSDYSGNSSFMSILASPSNSTYSLDAGSLIISSNTMVVIRSGSNQMVLLNSIPDFSQLPSTVSNPIFVVSVQFSTCSPPCSGSGVCTSNGTCSCLEGFSGTLCEACLPDYFGPSCTPCPQGCTNCDDGIGGTGQCLNATTLLPASCNCAHGLCNNSTNQCTCMAGWENPSNDGPACSVCSPGYYLDQTGNCRRALRLWFSR
jgi:hypothetical protein